MSVSPRIPVWKLTLRKTVQRATTAAHVNVRWWEQMPDPVIQLTVTYFWSLPTLLSCLSPPLFPTPETWVHLASWASPGCALPGPALPAWVHAATLHAPSHLPCCQHPSGLAAAPWGLIPTGTQPPTNACVTLILGPVLQGLLVKKVTADNTGVSGILHSMRDFIVGVSSLSFRLWLIYWLRLHFMWRTIFCLYITDVMELFAFI